MDLNTAFGLGVSGLGASVAIVIGWFIAKGIRSRCIAGGNVISVDVHRATPAELAPDAPSATHESVVVHVHPPTPTVVDEHAQPSQQIPRNTKVVRDSTPLAKKKIPFIV